MKTTEENNKMIAEFMGLDRVVLTDGIFFEDNNTKELHMIKYHSSWGWLMPVVEKVTSIELSDNPNQCNYIYIGFDFEDKSHYVNLYHGVCNGGQINGYSKDSKIKAVYDAVVQFIEWYNTNKG